MADVVELILADHDRIRRLLSALDDTARPSEDTVGNWPLDPVWRRLAGLTELHAEAEEEICHLAMFGQSQGAAEQRHEGVADHDDMREAIAEARLHPGGSALWWLAVSAARRGITRHIAREERGMLAAFGARATAQLRDQLARQWIVFIGARTRDAIPELMPRAALDVRETAFMTSADGPSSAVQLNRQEGRTARRARPTFAPGPPPPGPVRAESTVLSPARAGPVRTGQACRRWRTALASKPRTCAPARDR